MPYGTIKVDTITFTSGSSDVSVAISGLIQNPTFTGNVTVTGTVSGDVIRGQTVSGATVTGTAGQFGTLTGNTAGFTTVTGTTVTGTTANFATVSGTTVTGATARFTTTTGVSGVFTSQLSGATVTGDTFQGSNITGVSGVFTTRVSGATVTGNAIVGSTITGVSGVFTTVISGASGVIAGNITASAFIPTGSGVPTNGVYLPSANTVGIAANSSGILFATSSGVGIGTNSPSQRFEVFGTVQAKLTSLANSPAVSMGTPGGLPGLTIFTNQAASKQYDMACDADALTFRREGVDFARLTSSGQLLVGVTSANANGGILQLSQGITFPATAVDASDSNTLDDYEQGGFTPVIQGSTTNPSSVTYTGQKGSYTKIGNRVFIQIQLGTSAISGGSGILRVGGLPFTIVSASSNGYGALSVALMSNITFSGTDTMLGVLPDQGTTAINLMTFKSGAAYNDLQVSAWGANGSIVLCGVYQV